MVSKSIIKSYLIVGTDYIGGRENKVMPAQKLGLRNQIAITITN